MNPVKPFKMERSFPKGCDFQTDSVKKFGEHMRDSVWRIHVYSRDADTEDTNFRKVICRKGTGVCIDPTGLVLSAYHIFRHCEEGKYQIYGRPYRDGDYDYDITRPQRGHKFRVAKRLILNPTHDLVLLQFEDLGPEKLPKKEKEVNHDRFWYSKFAEKGDLTVGQKLIYIGHPNSRAFGTFETYIKYPAPPCDCSWRTVEPPPPYRSYMFRSSAENREVNNYGDQNKELGLVIVTNNTIESPRGASGSPLFDAHGNIVGLLSCGDGSELKHVHVAVLREFYEKHKAGDI